MKEVVIQEAIVPSECVFKVYKVFNDFVIKLNNQIDFTDPEKFTFEKAEVKRKVEREISDMEKEVGRAVAHELDEQGFHNFGLDFVRRKGTNEFYFFDVNQDNFHWAKAFVSDNGPRLRKGLIEKINKLYKDH